MTEDNRFVIQALREHYENHVSYEPEAAVCEVCQEYKKLDGKRLLEFKAWVDKDLADWLNNRAFQMNTSPQDFALRLLEEARERDKDPTTSRESLVVEARRLREARGKPKLEDHQGQHMDCGKCGTAAW